MNILHLCPDLNVVCGKTRYVLELLKLLNTEGLNLFLGSNKLYDGEIILPSNVELLEIEISPNNRNLINFFTSIKKLYEFIKNNNIEIIHTHHRYPELIASLVKSVFSLKVKIYSTVHSITYNKYPFQHKSNKIIAVSNYVKNHLINYHKLKPDKIEVIYNFVNSNFFRTNLDKSYIVTDKGKEHFIIFSAGRFHDDKDYFTLFNALKLLPDLPLKFILIGEGQLLNEYKHYIVSHQISDRVEILESKLDISELYLSADLCILPSKIEPLGFFILEAGLFSKPVIGSNNGGIAEIIEDNFNGLLFETHNPENLASKIKLLFEDSTLQSLLGDNLNKTVKNKFNSNIHLTKLMKIYNG